jgi:hypothetical protein
MKFLLVAGPILSLAVYSCSGRDDNTFEPPGDVGEYELTPLVLTTELVQGMNRFTFQILDKDSQNVPDAEVALRTALLDEQMEGELGEPQQAEYMVLELEELDTVVEHVHADGSLHVHSQPFGQGLYRAGVEFSEAGTWGIEVSIDYAGDSEEVPLVVTVLENGSTPGIGEPAPATENYTLDERPLEELSSDTSPDPELYETTVAEALEAGRPAVVSFATPAFCHTRVCAPVLEAVKEVKESHPNVSYIHIEPFENLTDPENLVDSPFVAEWGLPNEPWVFVVDGDGMVVAAFEGPFTVGELEEALAAAQ